MDLITYGALNNKIKDAVDGIDIPVAMSQLENDKGYIDEERFNTISEDFVAFVNMKAPDGLKYAFDSLNGVLYLYGRGFLDTQVTDIAPWKKYGEAIKSVVVFDGITKIGCRYFNELPNLQHVFLPNTVTSMDDYAFYNCNAIKSLVIPDSVNELRYYALASKGFEKMDFGRGISSLKKLCFRGCVSLHTIILRYDGVVDFEVVDATQLGCANDGGDCYVYVPAAHVAAYQSHDDAWSMYTGIRAIEDYPDICG